MCLNDQRSLLMELKNSLIFSPYFASKLQNWNETMDCCHWYGVECDDIGHVTSLQLVNMGISGGFVESSGLFGLKYLTKLNLAFNYFYRASIPRGLSNLTHLTHLNLSDAGFEGQVPDEISRMWRLISLDLSTWSPNLRLSSLQSLVQNLTNLRELHLDSVDLSAGARNWTKSLSSLQNLRSLSLSHCGLVGPLDSSLSKLHALSVLILDGNFIYSQVPDFIANFSALTTLSLAKCGLHGNFPEKTFHLPRLENLDLSTNGFLSGSIPQSIQSKSLRVLKISSTNFSGPLPESISKNSLLSILNLSRSKFTGQIPQAISNQTELVELDLSNNFFTCQIPSFVMTKKLRFISLTGNLLNGSLPSSVFKSLKNLEYLDLGSNGFSGEIPSTLFDLPFLNTIDLSNNQFNGTIQLQKFLNLPYLVILWLDYNNLSIDVSNSDTTVPHFSGLTQLSLASCNLSSFPDLRNHSRLSFLDLSMNQIKGKIPSWIWELGLLQLNLSHNHFVALQKPYNMSEKLMFLDLNSNQLQGTFPMMSSSSLYVDYSNNYFSTIPQNIVNSTRIRFFFASNNIVIGEIPISFCNSSYFEVLDLSNNELSGHIHPSLMENQYLRVLNIGRNKLSGNIHSNFSTNCGLETLDLSRNNLMGKVPPSLANCRSLQILNIGNNHINDRFPCSLANLSSLLVLILRNNRFYGNIGCLGANHSWFNLQVIDIASNYFNGNLFPLNISSWRGMTSDNQKDFTFHNFVLRSSSSSRDSYTSNTVRVMDKGQEIEVIKILTFFTSIDFSCNNFTGEIPADLGELNALNFLDLSHNRFNGEIPKSIGKMTQLQSLDLSWNKLKGNIPAELAHINFLSFLNLSYNMLVGKIPGGNQLQTFTLESYKGNSGLCGFPTNRSCSDSGDYTIIPIQKRRDIQWIYVFVAAGYVVGLGIFVLMLMFFPIKRLKYSIKIDQFLERIFHRHGRRKRRHSQKKNRRN